MRKRLVFLCPLLILLFSGCTQVEEEKRQAGVDVAIRSVNYNADRGVLFSLYDTSAAANGAIQAQPLNPLSLEGYYPVGGDNLLALSGGGINCCARLPEQWRPGLKYTVLWKAESGQINDPKVYRYMAELPRYERPEDLTVAFYPEHRAEFVIGSAMPGEAGWRGKEPSDPLTACMAKHEKKFCYMYLPHYENLADRQAESWRVQCREKLALKKAEINTEEKKQEFILFLQNQIQQAKIEKNSKWLREMEFEIKRENRPNRIGKSYCELWLMDCREDYDRIDSYDPVSNKKMCDINWRSPEFGE
ncbi:MULTISPECIES: DUF3304 domain-containing protein [unclassified Neisseria]|uniref:DUF3304 domain-containing protein n=1 Tax=unclassified Neisseria TaxID=2623750 RepID=UPI002666D192|nr:MULTISPECIES: DUF3304 domain-containing protein [unclassified Neisseria]MDO1510110.1 DUF3304 domain-containing protein [Neisseria sp. MVDL19-042950]MDO1516686.1 DUF3304 domain-containing protein [Neisseria sp. MVDL18-041461]MDO1563833.1 DUF3304 domain-containing protein [Neisseria sp. MVDL20-010259]